MQGVLQGTVDDLSQQLEKAEGKYGLVGYPSSQTCLCVCVCAGELRGLRKEVGQLAGEKAALQREVNKLRDQVGQTHHPPIHTLVVTPFTEARCPGPAGWIRGRTSDEE